MSDSPRRARIPTRCIRAALFISDVHLPAIGASAEQPQQTPGITLGTLDLQAALRSVCMLKPAQTPNVDKLMPTMDWTTAAAAHVQRQADAAYAHNRTPLDVYGLHRKVPVDTTDASRQHSVVDLLNAAL